MAEVVPVKAIIAQLKTELQRITKANGFQTDLGLSVSDVRSSTGIPTAPATTVAVTGKQRLDGGGVSVEGVVEIVLPATYATAMSTVYDGADDVERVLNELSDRMTDGLVTGSGALPPIYNSTTFLDRPEGMPVVAAEIVFTTGYRR